MLMRGERGVRLAFSHRLRMVAAAVWYNSGMEEKSDNQDEIMALYEGLRTESLDWGRVQPVRG